VLNVPCGLRKDSGNTGVIIPPKALELASRFCKAEIKRAKKLKRAPGTIGFGFSDTRVSFHLGEHKIVARAFEGPYPNYQQIVPEDNDQTVMFNCAELTATLKALAPHTDTLTHKVRFEIRRKSAKLIVSVPDTGEVTEKVPCKSAGNSFAPKPFVVGYNVYYLLNCLKHLPESEEVQFALSTPKKVTIFTTSEDGLMLIMPLRLS
jgi:DNA polymerase-3 subunit beta